MTDYQKRVAFRSLKYIGQYLGIVFIALCIAFVVVILPMPYDLIFATVPAVLLIAYYSYCLAKNDVEYEQRQEERLLERLKRENVI